jgi:hypothetical protein
MFPLIVRGKHTARSARGKALDLIAKGNLSKFADSYPHTLSGGMKQRVAIARGMAMEPDVRLMDEPFAALDALTRVRMQDELLALWDETKFTVIFVIHSIPEAIKIGSRILLLTPHPGQVKAGINSAPRDEGSSAASAELERKIHEMLFADEIEEALMPDTERPEVYRTPLGQEQFGIVAKPLTLFEPLYNQDWLRKLFVLVVIAALWEIYARWLDNELLVPTFSATVRALAGGIASGTIPARALLSMKVLLMGFAAGVSLAAVLTFFAISTRIGTDFLETMTAMFNPLPAIALLPLALIWFGLGTGSLVFVLVHSVLWD